MIELNVASKSSVTWRAGWVCAALSVISILAALPFVNMGVNDDFSYTQIAKNLAQSGTLIYNGWNTPMIGIQAYWAALAIRLFGFSFDLVRLSTLPFVAGSALFIYYLARRIGASVLLAALTSCFVMLSPLTIPLGASFMTDVPALFFVLLCFLATLRAVDSLANPTKWIWIGLLFVMGVVGGTVRQVVWLAPLCLLPYLAIRLNSARARLIVVLLWFATLLSVHELSAWFAAQPYSVVLPLLSGERATVRAIFLNLAGLYLECSVLFIPLFALYLTAYSRFTIRVKAAILSISIGFPAALVVLSVVHPSSNLIAFDYFAANIITKSGILDSGVEALGAKPIILSVFLQAVLLFGALLLELTAVVACLPIIKQALPWRKSPGRMLKMLQESGPAATLCQILAFFVAPYLVAVASRAFVGLAIDRYLLPLLVVGALIVVASRNRGPALSPRLAIFFLSIFCLYGVATTHDYFSRSRARLTAANELKVRKVKEINITAGLEFDGWTQIMSTGYINDPRIAVPAHAYIPQDGRTFPLSEPYWFWYFTPSIEPKYFVVLSPQPQLTPSDISPIAYTNWLPPFHRKILIEVKRPSQTVGRLEPISKP